MRVAIIGGGIAGLAAAYELELARESGVCVEYVLYEAGSRWGGVISSAIEEGSVLEHGPDSFLTEKPAAAQLSRELGLGASLIGSDDATRKTWILVRKRLVPLPDGLMFLVPTKLWPTLTTRLFSLRTKLRMTLELFTSRRPRGEDESIAQLVERHYGREAVDRLADPLLSGIYGGSASQLSAQSVLPRMVEMEVEHGSLTRGMLAGRRRMLASQAASGRGAKPVFTTLRGGLQQLIDGLVARLNPRALALNTPVSGLWRGGGRWVVHTAQAVRGEGSEFDAVIVATPTWSAASLLQPVDQPLSQELARVTYSSSITVNLVYDEAALSTLPAGFGFLVPPSEGRSLLACTFIHRKFPGRTAPGKAVLRAFLGGVRGESLMAERDDALLARVKTDLQQILGITAEPERSELRRWPQAMAQYGVGHRAQIESIRRRAAALPGLHLVGNAYDGIGISDCIRLGRHAAQELVARAKETLPDAQGYAPSLPSHSPIA